MDRPVTPDQHRRIEDRMRADARSGRSHFAGEPCRGCGNFTLMRAGTCLTCHTCGETTGCS